MAVSPQRRTRSRRHHLVARGFQRAWCDGGERILYVTKEDSSVRPVGTADAFLAGDLLTFATADGLSDAVETEFGSVESRTLPHVRRWVTGDRDGDAELAVRAIVALHWARSYSITGLQRRIWEAVTARLLDKAEVDSEFRAAFKRDFKKEPGPQELRDLTRQVVEQWETHNGHFVDRVQENYNFALNHFSDLHSQRATLARPGRVEFLFADSPVVLTRGPGGIQGTADTPIALKEAENMWCPLSPSVGVAFCTEPQPDLVATPEGAQQLNVQSWRYASRFLGARLGCNLDRSLAMPQGTFQITQPS